MPDRKLKKLKRKKVKAGHYIYAGYHIRRILWHPKSKIEREWNGLVLKREKGKGFLCWVVDGFDTRKWTRRRYATLERAISIINNDRNKLWDEVCKIEADKAEGNSA